MQQLAGIAEGCPQRAHDAEHPVRRAGFQSAQGLLH
jgi:hypothetical protein